MNYEYCQLTDQGRVRDNNEDYVFLDETHGLVLLADGMGGYNAGEVASHMAVTHMAAELGSWFVQGGKLANSKAIRRAMEASAENVNKSIFKEAHENPECAGMGTTLVMGVFLSGSVMVGHIGDSRCYCLRQNQLKQLTRDHSFLQEQLDAGLISPEQAAVSPHRNLVTRAMGVEPKVQLEVHEYRVNKGDLYLFCSDGLTDMVIDRDIGYILRATDIPLKQKARQLVDLANASGGRDNISVLLVQVDAAKRKTGLFLRWLGKKGK
jgi:PPM family protein phosphatase